MTPRNPVRRMRCALLTIPVCVTRVCYGARMSRPDQVRSRLQPSPRQECQGKPRCPAFGPLCSGSSDNRRPHRMRRFRRFRGSQTPAKPLTLHPPVFDGYHQSGQEQMPEPRTEPYRSGEHRYREISRLLRHPATTGRRRCPASPHLCRRPCRSAPKRPNRCAHSRHRFCPPPPCHSIPRSASGEPCPCNRSRRRPYPRTMRT